MFLNTSNEHVLRAILAFSGQHDVPVIIEAATIG